MASGRNVRLPACATGNRFRRMASVPALLALALLASTAPALAQEPESGGSPPSSGLGAGDLLIRARITGVLPYDLRSRIDLIGGAVQVDRMVLPDVDVSYFLTDHIAVTGQTGVLKTRFRIKGSLVGDIDVGSILTIPLALSADYHFLPDARFNPYLGVGAVATWYTGAKPASPLVKSFSVERQISPMVRIGMDVRMTEKWFANTEMRLVLPPTQVLTNSGVTARTDVKSLSLGVGVSYRF
ncbi:hypothetical protein ASG39_00735 [Rhizobium sp. Leaf371]|nr:hypothetical protein ASG39_00735 [Rhizobium sp. Leaf371]